MRLFGITTVFAALLAASVAGQDAIEFKSVTPKTGDRVKVTVDEIGETKLLITANGMEQAKKDTKTKSLVYVDEVTDNTANARSPAKLARTYEKAVVGVDGKTTKLPIEGKTVTIEKKGEKYSFSIDNKPLEGESLKLLDSEFNEPGREDTRDLMLPNKAVKPGDTWKIDTEKLTKSMPKDFKVDAAKAVAGGKLVKAYKQDGKQFGVFEVSFSMPITELGGKAAFKLKEGKLAVVMSGDGVIDGSSSQGKTKVVTQLAASGAGDGYDIKIDVTTTRTGTMEPLSKK